MIDRHVFQQLRLSTCIELFDVKLIDDNCLLSQTKDEVKDGPWAEYQLYVRTGDRVGAATKADVRVTLYGEKGRTKEIVLGKSSRNKIRFQRGKVCICIPMFISKISFLLCIPLIIVGVL